MGEVVASRTDIERAAYGAYLGLTEAEIVKRSVGELRDLFVQRGLTPTDTLIRGYKPEDSGLKASTIDTSSVATSSAMGTTAVGTRLYVPKGVSISNIVFSVGNAGATLTADQNGLAVYSPGGNLLSRSADASAAFIATGPHTLALSTPFTTQEDGYYDIIAWANGTTKPGLHRANTLGLHSLHAMRSFSVDAITTTPPATLGARTKSSHLYFFGLL